MMPLISKNALGILVIASSFSAYSNDVAPTPGKNQENNLPNDSIEINNNWEVSISNRLRLPSPLYVAIRKEGNHWKINGIFNSPPEIARTQDLEVFVATRDLQKWTNFYADMRTNCDSFEAREYEFHSVCTSSLAEKKEGLAFAGLFFGGSGKTPFAYTDEKVKAAINSIRPQQAMEALTAFEQGSFTQQKQMTQLALNQESAQRKAEETQAKARRKAPIGAKDWCEQTVKYYGAIMQIDPTFTCQNYGVVTEDILRSEGWAITRKQAREVGYAPQVFTVYDMAIEKAPR